MENQMPEDFDELMEYVEAIGDRSVDETTLYEHYYQQIEILNKLLTTKLSNVEVAVAKVRLGVAHLAAEEPHNAQPAFEQAADFFCPKLLSFAKQFNAETASSEALERTEQLLQELPVVRQPSGRFKYNRQLMELLNQLGILWFNRSLPLRACCFFQSCVEFFAWLKDQSILSDEADENQGKDAPETIVASAADALLEHLINAHFYLAQTFGALGLAKRSALSCLETLQLQITANKQFEPAQWLKNCLGLVEYFLRTSQLQEASLCLQACGSILNDWKSHLDVQDAQEGADQQDEQRQTIARIQLAWLKLHLMSLKTSSLAFESADGAGDGEPSTTAATQATLISKDCAKNSDLARLEQLVLQIGAGKSSHGTAFRDNEQHGNAQVQRFVAPESIRGFEQARDVFRMALAAAEAAKRVFVLDGFVTQHVEIVQQQNELFKRLIVFESDFKRKVAMQLRRVQLLEALLNQQLNPTFYSNKLQELWFELGEVFGELVDLKQRKPGSEQKANSYAAKAINAYQEYLLLFFHGANEELASARRSLDADISKFCLPSRMELNDATVRLVLEGVFALARVYGKADFPKDVTRTVNFWKKSLEYYTAVLALAKTARIGMKPPALPLSLSTFQVQLQICDEMTRLLPEKINQRVFNHRML